MAVNFSDSFVENGFHHIQSININSHHSAVAVADVEPWNAAGDNFKTSSVVNTQLIQLPTNIMLLHSFNYHTLIHMYRFYFSMPGSDTEFVAVETMKHKMYSAKASPNILIIRRAAARLAKAQYKQYGHKHLATIENAVVNIMLLKLEHVNMERTEPVKPVTIIASSSVGYSSSDVPSLSRRLPGVDSLVEPACDCLCYVSGAKAVLWDHIQHLNDMHKDWTRERIADWLDDLHDKGLVNIDFPSKESESEKPALAKVPDSWKNLGYTTDFSIDLEVQDVSHDNMKMFWGGIFPEETPKKGED